MSDFNQKPQNSEENSQKTQRNSNQADYYDFFEEDYEKAKQKEEELHRRREPLEREEVLQKYKSFSGSGSPQFSCGGPASGERPSGQTGSPLKKTTKIAFGVLAVVLAVLIFFFGVFCSKFFGSDASMLNEIYRTIQRYYYEDPDNEELIMAAGKAMVESLDRYSTFLSPLEYYELMNPTSGKSKLGASYTRKDGGDIVVYDVNIGSGAYDAGLRRGDVVLAVNGIGVTSSMTNAEFLQQVNRSATLQVRRTDADGAEQIYTYSVAEKEYTFTFVEYYFRAGGNVTTNMSDAYREYAKVDALSDGIGYLRLTEFMSEGENDEILASKDFANAMDLFRSVYGGKGKLVLDLQNNPGGRIDVAADIASYLLYRPDSKRLKLSVLRTRNNAGEETYYTDSVYEQYFDVTAAGKQIVCLTNGNSASASEMLLGAMLDYQTAEHVGTSSYGKGIAQSIVPIQRATIVYDGQEVESYYAVYLTVARFFTPVGNVCMHGIPYQPAAGNVQKTYEQQMQRANALFAAE